MSSSTSTAHSLNKILNQFRTSSKSRHAGETDEGVKKLRRLILVEGIPSGVVCFSLNGWVLTTDWVLYSNDRITHCVLASGKYCYACMNYQRRHSCNMLPEGPVKSEKRSEMILSGMPRLPIPGPLSDVVEFYTSTLATDRGFKERVREDMLVRLLDAFVWRNYG